MIDVRHGDSRDVLKTLPDESVDAVACDPPYALVSIVKRFGKPGSAPAQEGIDGAYRRASAGFMGHQWDTGETAHDPDFWSEVLRVLKPGGHLVAFAGSRTYHRMACAIEDAGFELRDMILDLVCSDQRMVQFIESLGPVHRDALLAALTESGDGGMLAWLYGTGFPKSHNMSKAIDKLMFDRWLDQNVDQKLRYQGEMMIAEQSGPDAEDQVYQKYRELSGTARPIIGKGSTVRRPGADQEKDESWEKLEDRTYTHFTSDGATPEAQQWDSWGTALKPALEPMVLARKPISEKSVHENVLMYGTGAINIDATRIGGGREKAQHAYDEGQDNVNTRRRGLSARERTQHISSGDPSETIYGNGEGLSRWPANVIHDGSDEVHQEFARYGESSSTRSTITRGPGDIYTGTYGKGSPSRFFFSGKANRTDRWGSKHPTVKPVEVMRWIIRLITPKGGTVLDPFAGSGTTGVAALAEGVNAILIEREPEFYKDILERMAHYSGDGKHSVVARNRNKTEKKGTLL